MHIHQRNQSAQGFTLVELAIVITIIGLLIGGVLKGQEMIQNARITATIAQVHSYRAAIETFRDRFDQLPGDFSVAQTRLPGCTDDITCFNGNGDGRIGQPNSGINLMQHGNVTTNNRRETSLFFKHLALADLIGGVDAGANIATPIWGKTHPAAPISGGFNVAHVLGSGSMIRANGTYLRLQANLSGTTPYSGTDSCTYGPSGNLCAPVEAISPRDAAVIDRKMDDGLPRSGSVMSDDRSGTAGPCEGVSPGFNYNETINFRLCTMFFSIF